MCTCKSLLWFSHSSCRNLSMGSMMAIGGGSLRSSFSRAALFSRASSTVCAWPSSSWLLPINIGIPSILSSWLPTVKGWKIFFTLIKIKATLTWFKTEHYFLTVHWFEQKETQTISSKVLEAKILIKYKLLKAKAWQTIGKLSFFKP